MADIGKQERERAERDRLRAIRFLRDGPARLRDSAERGRLLLESEERGTISLAASALGDLKKDGLVTLGEGGCIEATAAGQAFGRRAASPADPFRAQHWELEHRVVAESGEAQKIAVNLAESPLAGLARHRTRKGEPFLSAAEAGAGERLRSDYTRGQIMPRLGANWIASVTAGRRSAGKGGAVELTEAALAARQRVDRALDAVGPELSGVLVDICCFLKGMEQVERERGWPARSAKIVLKTALGVLARHYNPPRERPAGRPATILHWGAEGYRPRVP